MKVIRKDLVKAIRLLDHFAAYDCVMQYSGGSELELIAQSIGVARMTAPVVSEEKPWGKAYRLEMRDLLRWADKAIGDEVEISPVDGDGLSISISPRGKMRCLETATDLVKLDLTKNTSTEISQPELIRKLASLTQPVPPKKYGCPKRDYHRGQADEMRKNGSAIVLMDGFLICLVYRARFLICAYVDAGKRSAPPLELQMQATHLRCFRLDGTGASIAVEGKNAVWKSGNYSYSFQTSGCNFSWRQHMAIEGKVEVILPAKALKRLIETHKPGERWKQKKELIKDNTYKKRYKLVRKRVPDMVELTIQHGRASLKTQANKSACTWKDDAVEADSVFKVCFDADILKDFMQVLPDDDDLKLSRLRSGELNILRFETTDYEALLPYSQA